MSSCNGDCSHCSSSCSKRDKKSLLEKLNPKASVKKVIAVVSGKGGVGKSTVTSLLAVDMAREGKREHRRFREAYLQRDNPRLPR